MAASNMPSDSTHRSEEGRHHRETTASVRLKAQRLRRALDADRLDDAIKIAADVAAELRSPSAIELSPKGYYDVYLSVCAELRLLEMYVMESARRGAPVLELYERVQETPLVLPRLYLLVTAGSVYAKSLQAPAKDVLRDLVEMCAGVQHPQRGLFLRAYLAQMMKDKLPDAVEDIEGSGEDSESGGTVQDSIDFVIRNFTEMNRLWVRMQHDGSPRDMELREKERLELRLLVGSNIATLSRLVGDNLSLYRDNVLPAILEQIVSCEDAIAQEYLADCVAQVFPDDFQLATLEAFMGMCSELVKGVNMRTILVSMIDRLTRFAASSTEGAEATRIANAFHVFRSELPGVMKRQGKSLALIDRLYIYQSLMSFALQAEPDRTDYVDVVLGFCVADMDDTEDEDNRPKSDDISKRDLQRNEKARLCEPLRPEDERLTMKVLSMPLESFKSVGATLKLENYVVLQRFLTYENQKLLAARLLMSANEYEPCIHDVTMLERLFQFVKPLVQDEPSNDADGTIEQERDKDLYGNFDAGTLTHHHEYLMSLFPANLSAAPIRKKDVRRDVGFEADGTGGVSEEEDEDFERNQELVARIVYLLEASDIENTTRLYSVLRQELLVGGEKRLKHTLPSLVFASLRLALRCGGGEGEEQMERMLTFAAESIEILGGKSALLALRLRLHVARTAASLGADNGRFVYDNLAEAFVAFEQEVTSSREQNLALELIVSQFGHVRNVLDAGAYEALSTRAVKHAGRALTRSDQCVLLLRCALLFTAETGERALGCVRRAMTAAEWCVSGAERVLLFLDVSSVSIQLQKDGVCDVCQGGFLANVLKKIREIISSKQAKGSALGKVVVARYQRVVSYIRGRLELFEGLDVAEL